MSYRIVYRDCWIVEVNREGQWVPVFYTDDQHSAAEYVRERT